MTINDVDSCCDIWKKRSRRRVMRKLLRNERTAVPKNMNVTVAFLITDGRLKEQFFHILP